MKAIKFHNETRGLSPEDYSDQALASIARYWSSVGDYGKVTFWSGLRKMLYSTD